MECPNGHGEMEMNRHYIEVGDYGVLVWAYICQECQYKEVECAH